MSLSRKTFCTVLLFTLLQIACNPIQLAPVTPAPTSTSQRVEQIGDANDTFDNLAIRIDWVKIGSSSGDIIGNDEIFFDLLVIRQNGDSRRLQAPGLNTYRIRGEDNRIYLDGFSLNVNGVGSNEKILMDFLAFESDKLDFFTSSTADLAFDSAVAVLEQGLSSGVLLGKAITHANIIAFVISSVSSVALDWWQEADPLGGFAIILEPSNGWLAGGTYEGRSDDGNATIQFTIIRHNKTDSVSTVVMPILEASTNTPILPTSTLIPLTNTLVPPINPPITDTTEPSISTPIPPTNTLIPPTSTPIPPTNTLIPPTSTLIPLTNTPVPPEPTSPPIPSATLFSNTLIEQCKWDVRISLSRFSPNSLITISSSYNEIECATGIAITSSWNQLYHTRTDHNGNLVVAYLHQGTGSYNYTFTDENGNQAALSFSTTP